MHFVGTQRGLPIDSVTSFLCPKQLFEASIGSIENVYTCIMSLQILSLKGEEKEIQTLVTSTLEYASHNLSIIAHFRDSQPLFPQDILLEPLLRTTTYWTKVLGSGVRRPPLRWPGVAIETPFTFFIKMYAN